MKVSTSHQIQQEWRALAAQLTLLVLHELPEEAWEALATWRQNPGDPAASLELPIAVASFSASAILDIHSIANAICSETQTTTAITTLFRPSENALLNNLLALYHQETVKINSLLKNARFGKIHIT